MSLLERLGHRHLNDRAFARVWTTGGGHPHLESCAACRARFEEFEQWVLGIGDAVRTEADDVLTPERLSVQQGQIARRLESMDRPPRVIPFPKAARAVINGHSHVRRWVTVAAAAGLIAGVGLGQALHPWADRSPVIARHTPPQIARGTAPPVSTKTQATDRMYSNASYSQSDDELLSDAVTQPRVTSLSALDDMTPHARDLTQREK